MSLADAVNTPDRLVKEAVSHWGTVDVLVNNAGITRDTLIMRMKPDQWQSVIDTNLSAVFYASQVSFEMSYVAPAPGMLWCTLIVQYAHCSQRYTLAQHTLY